MNVSLYLSQHRFFWQQIPKGNVIFFHSVIFLPSVISVYGGNWTFISVLLWELRWRGASANHANSLLFPVLLHDLPAYVTLSRMHFRPVHQCAHQWDAPPSLGVTRLGSSPPRDGWHWGAPQTQRGWERGQVAGEEGKDFRKCFHCGCGCPWRQGHGSAILIASSGS